MHNCDLDQHKSYGDTQHSHTTAVLFVYTAYSTPNLSFAQLSIVTKFKLKFAKIDTEGDTEIDARSSLGKNILSKTLSCSY